MVSIAAFKQLTRSLPAVTEQPHFDKVSYRVNKKIFATLNEGKNQACLKLSLSDQDLFSLYDPAVLFPVPNKWGKQGWTFVNLDRVPEAMLRDALMAAYSYSAQSK